MSFYLVGEASSPGTIDRPDLWLRPDASGIQHTGNRLLALTGWTFEEYFLAFPWRTNLWRSSKRLWSAEGRLRAVAIRQEAKDREACGIIVLGVHAADCFGLRDWPFFTWKAGPVKVAAVPNPCGRAKFWSASDARPRAAAFFKDALARVRAAS